MEAKRQLSKFESSLNVCALETTFIVRAEIALKYI